MADRPLAAGILMAGVGAGGSVTKSDGLRHVVPHALNGSGKSSIPRPHEFPIPVFGGQPEFHLNERVGSRFEIQLNAAVFRNISGWRGGSAASSASPTSRSGTTLISSGRGS